MNTRTPLTAALGHFTHFFQRSLRGSHELQPGGLAASARASPLIKVSIRFWPPRIIVQLSPASQNSVQQSRHSVSMCKTCPNHHDLVWCNTCSNVWTLRHWSRMGSFCSQFPPLNWAWIFLHYYTHCINQNAVDLWPTHEVWTVKRSRIFRCWLAVAGQPTMYFCLMDVKSGSLKVVHKGFVCNYNGHTLNWTVYSYTHHTISLWHVPSMSTVKSAYPIASRCGSDYRENRYPWLRNFQRQRITRGLNRSYTVIGLVTTSCSLVSKLGFKNFQPLR